MDPQLKATIILGRISGCLPVHDLKSLEYTIRHPAFVYSLIIFTAYSVFESISFFSQRNVIAEMQPSKIIVLYLVSVNNIISCITTRIWVLFRCSRLSDLILNLVNVMKDTTFKKGSYICRYYILGYIILNIDLIPVGFYTFSCIFDSASELPLTVASESYLPTGMDIPSWLEACINLLRQLIQIQTRYFALAIIVFMGVNLLHGYENFCSELQNSYCTEAVSTVHIIDDEDDLEQDEIASDSEEAKDVTDKGQEQGQKVSKKDLTVSAMTDFIQKIPTVFGNQWASININGNQHVEKIDTQTKEETIATILNPKKTLWASASATMRTSLTLKELSDKFLEIQRYFDDYNKVAGPCFFILIFYATIGLIHKLYAVASSEFSVNDKLDGTMRYFCKSAVAFLLIAGLSHLGEVISTRMRKWKEQLKCVMLTELLCEKDHDSTNTLTESVVKWDWQLTAMNLFNINHALLPAIAGTMITYLIVIIQLKVSEAPGVKNGTV